MLQQFKNVASKDGFWQVPGYELTNFQLA